MSNGARLDLFLLDCVGTLVKGCVEPHCKNLPLWDGGLRDVAAEKLKEMGITSKPVTLVQLARQLGILDRDDPNEIRIADRNEIANPPKRRRAARV